MEPNATEAAAYNRKTPCIARLKRSRLLTEGCLEKDTHHYEIDLSGSGMIFEPGDSLALFSTNDSDLVDEIIAVLGFSGEEIVTDPNKEEVPLREALMRTCTITRPHRKFLEAVAEKATDSAAFASLLDKERKKDLEDYLWGREIIDFLLAYPEARFEAGEFVSTLSKHNDRLYSIASSLASNPEEVHLTVADVAYESLGRKRKGVCSTFLAERTTSETPLPCFISPGKGFRLPAPEEDTPIIMVGPGTGVAPYRAFVQHRGATAAAGKAWLFFGEIHRETCFFYEDEWNAALASGTLTKISTAFSRDQEHKVYVHHRIVEEGAVIWSWLQEGAILYVCGDAQRMAPDVDKALHEVIARHGGKSPEEAAAYVEAMHKDKRYRRDVY